MVAPFLKAVGGKRWLAGKLSAEILAKSPKHYIEPFLGGGAVALAMPGMNMGLGDTNATFIEVWRCVQQHPDELFREVAEVESIYDAPEEPAIALKGYLAARAELNEIIHHDARPLWLHRAALTLWLNARCYNGLWRVNKSGLFNVPSARYVRPKHISLWEIRQASAALANAQIMCGDYLETLGPPDQPATGVAVFADPPYDAMFGQYTADGFNATDQRNLATRLHQHVLAGGMVWATNSDTPLIRELYSWASIESVDETHTVGPKANTRGKARCLLIRGGL